MSATLENFVTVKTTRGDVLPYEEYLTIVSMIKSMSYYNDLSNDKLLLDAHLITYDDPHQTGKSIFPDIVNHVYNIYTQMTATPLSLPVFTKTIALTVDFLEIIRRIVINRYLYNQIKNADGSINTTTTPVLGPDWGYLGIPSESVSQIFSTTVPNESQFISQGITTAYVINNNIFNANEIVLNLDTRKVAFYTSQADTYLSPYDKGNGYTQPIVSVTNSIYVEMGLINTPSTTVVIASFQNSLGVISLYMNTDRSIDVFVNSIKINTQSIQCATGEIVLSLSPTGQLEVVTANDSFMTNSTPSITTIAAGPITSVTLGVSVSDPGLLKSIVSSSGTIVIVNNDSLAFKYFIVYDDITPAI